MDLMELRARIQGCKDRDGESQAATAPVPARPVMTTREEPRPAKPSMPSTPPTGPAPATASGFALEGDTNMYGEITGHDLEEVEAAHSPVEPILESSPDHLSEDSLPGFPTSGDEGENTFELSVPAGDEDPNR